MIGAGRSPDTRLVYVDGLRALAILAVIGFHADVPFMPGGFVGVDIFFVISGFVITRQIAISAIAGHFSFTEFFARRALRILPPLLLVTALTVLLARFFPLLPAEITELHRSAAATAAIISNYFFSFKFGYFAKHSEIQPLLHTWSLGVEEQYYLIAPAFLVGLVALAKKRDLDALRVLIAACVIAIVVSFAVAWFWPVSLHRLGFYAMWTRIWQFSLGALVGLASLRGLAWPGLARQLATLIGLAAIAVAVIVPGLGNFPTSGAIAATIGTALLLAAGLGQSPALVTRIFSLRALVAIGLVSYSWYLWHWPVLVFARANHLMQIGLPARILAALAALGLAVITYFWLERATRQLRHHNELPRYASRIVAAGLAGSAGLAIVALLSVGGPPRHPISTASLEVNAISYCRGERIGQPPGDINACFVGGGTTPNVIVWGDSHAWMFYRIADAVAKSGDRTAAVFALPGCPPTPSLTVPFTKTCAGQNDTVSRWLSEHPAIDGAILTARWALYNGMPTPSGKEGIVSTLVRRSGPAGASYLELLREGLDRQIAELQARGIKRILIVGPLPELRQSAVDCLARAGLSGSPLERCGTQKVEFQARVSEINRVLTAVARDHAAVRLIDPASLVCNESDCLPADGPDILYIDDNHLSRIGADRFRERFANDLMWVFKGP